MKSDRQNCKHESEANDSIAKKGLESPTLFDRLSDLFHQKKLHMDKDLKLAFVCKLLHTNPRKLGAVLKNKGYRNFAHFVNYHRVKDACAYMNSSENNIYTLEAIAEMSNFGSRMAFYNAFEMIVGVKPSQYRAAVKKRSVK